MTRSAYLLAFPMLLGALLSPGALAASPPAPNEFVLFAGESLRARGLVVKSGDVGANVSVLGTKRIDAGTSTLAGDSVSLHPGSTCDELLANRGQPSSGCGPATPVTNPIIGNVAAACGAPQPFPTCNPGARVFVAHGATTVLQPGAYGDVVVSGGGAGPGTLVLAGGAYTFCSLLVARNGQVAVRAASDIRVVGSVKLDNGSNLGPESSATGPCDVRLFANGAKVRLSRRAAMTGLICAPNAKLEMTVGANLFGAAYAREVKTDRVFLELPACRTSTSTTTTPVTTTSSSSAPSTSTSTTTSTTPTTGTCGNGQVDPGEPCDPSSPGGAFDCPEGSTCSSECTCLVPTTTSTSSTTVTVPSTSSTSTSTTSTTNPCGNGQVDPGEPCDPSSPGGAFTCPEGSTCTEQCTCAGVPTTSTSSSTTTSSSTVPTTSTSTVSVPTTTTTTSSSSSTVAPTTSSTSTVAPTTSSTSTVAPTTSSTSTSTSTPTQTTMPGPAGHFDFTSAVASGTCGQTFKDLAGTIPLKSLLCGNLSLGGGASQVPDNSTPSGATNRFTLSCTGSSCTVGAVDTPTADYDCTTTGCFFGTPLPIKNAGLSVCVVNTYSQPASGTLDTATGAASLNFQLNSRTILTSTPNQPCPRCSVSVGGAACVGSLASPCTGVCDGSPNQGSACTTLNPDGLTRDCPAPAADQATSRCYRGSNNGAVCSASSECPSGTCSLFIGDIPIALNPLTTGTTSKSSSAGTFCPGQTSTQKGAFKSDICQSGANSGKPCTAATAVADCGAGVNCRSGTLSNFCSAGTNINKGCAIATDCGTGGTCVKAGTLAQLISATGAPSGALSLNVPKAVKLASVFCVGVTTNGTVNGNANLPGPGATTLVGNLTLLP